MRVTVTPTAAQALREISTRHGLNYLRSGRRSRFQRPPVADAAEKLRPDGDRGAARQAKQPRRQDDGVEQQSAAGLSAAHARCRRADRGYRSRRHQYAPRALLRGATSISPSACARTARRYCSWRTVLADVIKLGLRRPEFLIVDGAPGLGDCRRMGRRSGSEMHGAHVGACVYRRSRPHLVPAVARAPSQLRGASISQSLQSD
jgi:hypothetical protein